MSVNAVDQTTGNTTPLAGNTNNLVGNLSALTTNTKSDAVGAINEVNQTKQNATDNNLQTTDKTIVGGINELRSGLINRRGISAYNLNVELAVFDGISSYGAYLNSAFLALQGYINNLPNGALIHIDRLNIGNISINNPSSRLVDKTTTVGSIFVANFVDFDIVNQSVTVRKVSMYAKTFEEINGNTYTDYTNNVPEAGGSLSVAVTVYELLS